MKMGPIFAIAGFIILLTFFRGGIEAATKGSYLVPFDEIPVRFTDAMFVGIVIFILCWIIELRYPRPLDPNKEPTLVCPKCEKVKEWDGMLPCKCGGHFEDIQTMKWMDG